MAATSNTTSTFSICKSLSPSSFSIPSHFPVQFLRFQNPSGIPVSLSSANCSLIFKNLPLRTTRKLRSFTAAATEAEETLVPEGQADSVAPSQGGGDEAPTTNTIDQMVSVPVSPSDILTMFFLAEGTMAEMAIPIVTNALEETEGVTDLRVRVLEGIASVELTKQTTVQATGVASNLVEIIQSKGFKLQTLNLSFLDEEDLS